MAVFVDGVIHNAEATYSNLLYNPVSAEFQTLGQSCVMLSGHPIFLLCAIPRGAIVWMNCLFVKTGVGFDNQ
jgi:hypothetical protein